MFTAILLSHDNPSGPKNGGREARKCYRGTWRLKRVFGTERAELEPPAIRAATGGETKIPRKCSCYIQHSKQRMGASKRLERNTAFGCYSFPEKQTKQKRIIYVNTGRGNTYVPPSRPSFSVGGGSAMLSLNTRWRARELHSTKITPFHACAEGVFTHVRSAPTRSIDGGLVVRTAQTSSFLEGAKATPKLIITMARSAARTHRPRDYSTPRQPVSQPAPPVQSLPRVVVYVPVYPYGL